MPRILMKGVSAMPMDEVSEPQAELVFGLVYPLGAEVQPVVDVLQVQLKKFGYAPNVIRISEYLSALDLKLDSDSRTESERLIRLGNKACDEAKRKDFLALAAVSEIAKKRSGASTASPEPKYGTAHIIRSLKRPEEINRLREIYRPGFYAIGIFSSEDHRLSYLTNRKGYDPADALHLIETDQDEDDDFGQRTRETFHLADVFVDRDASYESQIERFLRLIFGHPFETPHIDEHGMFLAAAASARSSQSGRQVGASILNGRGDILAVGCNEVPRSGGGSYWPEDENDARDHKRDPDSEGKVWDSNFRVRREIRDDILKRLEPSLKREISPSERLVSGTKLDDITEYGRAVHAEMDALLSCARAGTTPLGAVLYTITFPCHNCARHIIAAGIAKLVYIEPYPKSRAWDLHDDALSFDSDARKPNSVPFVPFFGIAPRRYLELFSADPKKRKQNGRLLIGWSADSSRRPRVPMLAASYLERELMAVKGIDEVMRKLEGGLCANAAKSQNDKE